MTYDEFTSYVRRRSSVCWSPSGGDVIATPPALVAQAPGFRGCVNLRLRVVYACVSVGVPTAAPRIIVVLEQPLVGAAGAERPDVTARLALHHAPHLVHALLVWILQPRRLHPC